MPQQDFLASRVLCGIVNYNAFFTTSKVHTKGKKFKGWPKTKWHEYIPPCYGGSRNIRSSWKAWKSVSKPGTSVLWISRNEKRLCKARLSVDLFISCNVHCHTMGKGGDQDPLILKFDTSQLTFLQKSVTSWCSELSSLLSPPWRNSISLHGKNPLDARACHHFRYKLFDSSLLLLQETNLKPLLYIS